MMKLEWADRIDFVKGLPDKNGTMLADLIEDFTARLRVVIQQTIQDCVAYESTKNLAAMQDLLAKLLRENEELKAINALEPERELSRKWDQWHDRP